MTKTPMVEDLEFIPLFRGTRVQASHAFDNGLTAYVSYPAQDGVPDPDKITYTMWVGGPRAAQASFLVEHDNLKVDFQKTKMQVNLALAKIAAWSGVQSPCDAEPNHVWWKR